MDTLKFCRDGQLRTHFFEAHPGGEEAISRWIYVRAFETVLDRDLFSKFFSARIQLEDGLTVREFMLNLKPWSKQLSEATSIDFDAYLEELEKDADEPDLHISHVELTYQVELREEPNYEFGEDRKYSSRKILPAKALVIEEHWSSDAVLKEEARAEYDGARVVSMSLSPLNEWRDVPIKICETASLSDMSLIYSDVEAQSQPVLNENHPLAQKVTNNNDERVKTDFVLRPPTPTFHDTIIEGFFGYMFYHKTPEDRDAFAEGLRLQVEGIKNGTIETREFDLDELMSDAREERYSIEEVSPEEMEAFQASKEFEGLLLEAEKLVNAQESRG